jgi:hypothetical protein
VVSIRETNSKRLVKDQEVSVIIPAVWVINRRIGASDVTRSLGMVSTQNGCDLKMRANRVP